MNSIFGMFGIMKLLISCKVNVKGFTLTLQETRNIHDHMNIQKKGIHFLYITPVHTWPVFDDTGIYMIYHNMTLYFKSGFCVWSSVLDDVLNVLSNSAIILLC